MNPADSAPDGLLLSRDLIFTSKVTGTAQALGHRVRVVAGVAKATSLLAEFRPKAAFLDLAAGDLVAPEAIASYKLASPNTVLVAFGSHVDTDALALAKSAGCDRVMPRSKFTVELPELIRSLLGESR